jgi:hypothetical protein
MLEGGVVDCFELETEGERERKREEDRERKREVCECVAEVCDIQVRKAKAMQINKYQQELVNCLCKTNTKTISKQQETVRNLPLFGSR